MSRLNLILESVIGAFLREALSDDDKKKVDTWKKGSNSFSDSLFGGPDEDKNTFQRRHFAYQHSDESPIKAQIQSHFDSHGLEIADYRAGLVKDKIGRKVAIGGKLRDTKADPTLIQKFANDPVRKSKGRDDLQILISRHPHDVAGMTSKGQSWCDSSCMNFQSGSNRHYLQNDLQHGTHVAYLVPKGDDGHPERAVARVAIKRHVSGDGQHFTLHPENKIYGEAPPSFLTQVQDILDREHNESQPFGTYTKERDVYNDTGSYKQYHVGKDWEKALAHDHPAMQAAGIKHRDVPSEVLDKALDPDSGMSQVVSTGVFSNPNHRSRHVEMGLSSPHWQTREAAISSIWALPSHHERVWETGDPTMKVASLGNPGAPRHIIQKGLEHHNTDFIKAAFENPSLDQTHIEHILRNYSPSSEIYRRALSHRKMNKPHLFDIAIENLPRQSNNFLQVPELSRNKSIPAQHITHLLKPEYISHSVPHIFSATNWGDEHTDHLFNMEGHSGRSARGEYLSNAKSIKPTHIEKAIKMGEGHHLLSNKNVSLEASQLEDIFKKNDEDFSDDHFQQLATHKNLSPRLRKKLLAHNNPQVAALLYQRDDITPEEFETGIGHHSIYVRSAAAMNKDIPEHLLHTIFANPQSNHAAVRNIITRGHPKINSSHIDTMFQANEKGVLNDQELAHATRTFGDQLNDSHFEKASRHANAYIRRTAAESPFNKSKAALFHAINDSDYEVAKRAASNNNLTPFHLKSASDVQGNLALDLAKHPNHDSESISHFLNHPNSLVRSIVTKTHNSKLNDDHIHQIIDNDENYSESHGTSDVARFVNENPKRLQPSHITKLIQRNDPLVNAQMFEVNYGPEHVEDVMKSPDDILKMGVLAYHRHLVSDSHLEAMSNSKNPLIADFSKAELINRKKKKDSTLQESRRRLDPISACIESFISRR